MFTRVLVGVDARPGGRDAISLARHLADDRQLSLAYVHDGDLAPPPAPGLAYDADAHEVFGDLLEKERDAAGLADVRLLTTSAPSAGEGLHRLAEEDGADLLVVGSCSRGRLGRAMLGNDTRAALNGAPCAVAIAPRGYAELERELSVIGVGYDGGPESEAALSAARDLAARSGAKIRVREVVTMPSYAYTSALAVVWDGDINGLIADAHKRLAALEGIEGDVVYGLAGEALVAFSREVDLLLVGSRGYGPARRLVEGSTSNQLLGQVHTPLLVMPRSAASHRASPGGALATTGAAH